MDYDYFPPTEPVYAIILILFFVGLFSILLRYFFRYLIKNKKTQEYKLIIIIAEVLGAIGLIGLITFSGRVKISSEAYQVQVLNTRAIAVLNKNIKDLLASSLCISAVKPEDIEEDSVNGLCAFLQKYESDRNINVQWNVAKRAANTITNQFIVAQNSDLGLKAFSVASAIKDFQDTRSKVSRSNLNEFFLKIQDSWLFLILCAIFAGFGISIKVARAYIDWQEEKEKSSNPKKPANTQLPAAAARE